MATRLARRMDVILFILLPVVEMVAGQAGGLLANPILPSGLLTGSEGDDISCAMRNRCQHPHSTFMHYRDRNCFCDSLCEVYGDCCRDYEAGHVTRPPIKPNKDTFMCDRVVEVNPEAEMYVVKACPKDYTDDAVKAKCEQDLRDVFYRLPVTGIASQILYKNYYCAKCSGDINITFWHVKYSCGDNPITDRSADPKDIVENVFRYTQENRYFCGFEFFHPQTTPRYCKSHIDKCQKGFKDKRTKKKCRSHTAYVYAGKTVFKNKHCAKCNNINETYLSCEDTRTPKGMGDFTNTFGAITAPFSIMMDVNSGEATILEQQLGADGGNEDTVTDVHVRSCPPDHVYDPFKQACRYLLPCPPTHDVLGVACVLRTTTVPTTTTTASTTTTVAPTTTVLSTTVVGPSSSTILSTISTMKTTAKTTQSSSTLTTTFPFWFPPKTSTIDYNIFNFDPNHNNEEERGRGTSDVYNEGIDENINIEVDVTIEGDMCHVVRLNISSVHVFHNKTLLILSSGLVLEPDSYKNNGTHIYYCEAAEEAQAVMFIFDRIQDLVSFVGVLMSVVGLLITFIVYMMLPPLRTAAGNSVICLVVSLLVGQLLFLFGLEQAKIFYMCLTFAAIMHYAFLASFFWMNVLAYDVWRTIIARPPPIGIVGANHGGGQACRFFLYSLYAWFMPGIIVGGSLAMDLTLQDYVDKIFRPHYAQGPICWILRWYPLLFLFALPIAILTLANLIFFLASCSQCCCGRPSSDSGSQEKQKGVGRLCIYTQLSLLMAITWGFAYTAYITKIKVLWYVFIGLFSAQGVFICFAFACNKKVFKLMRDKGRVHRMHSDGRYYSNGRLYGRKTFLADGEAKIISQETSI